MYYRNSKVQERLRLLKQMPLSMQGTHDPGYFDFVFTDLWHDVSDGKDMYLKMKEYEKRSPNTIFSYWIEKSILCYL